MAPRNEAYAETENETVLGAAAKRIEEAREAVNPGTFPRGIPEVVHWARVTALGLPHTHSAILKDLSYYADHEGWCRVSQDVLGVVCGKSRSVVCESLLDMERLGILTSSIRRNKERYNKEYRFTGYAAGWQPEWPDAAEFGRPVIERLQAKMDAYIEERDAYITKFDDSVQENNRLRRLLEVAGIDPDLAGDSAVEETEEGSNVAIHEVPEGIRIRNSIDSETGEILFLYEEPVPSVVNHDTWHGQEPREPEHSPSNAADPFKSEVEAAVLEYWDVMKDSPENPKGWKGKQIAVRFYTENPDRFHEQMEVFRNRRAKWDNRAREDVSSRESPTAQGAPSEEAQEIWRAVLLELQLQLPRSAFQTWLKETTGHSLSEDRMVITAPTTFAVTWLERRMYNAIQKTIEKVTQKPLEVFFAVQPTNDTPTQGG